MNVVKVDGCGLRMNWKEGLEKSVSKKPVVLDEIRSEFASFYPKRNLKQNKTPRGGPKKKKTKRRDPKNKKAKKRQRMHNSVPGVPEWIYWPGPSKSPLCLRAISP
jgi:hypothetical protein